MTTSGTRKFDNTKQAENYLASEGFKFDDYYGTFDKYCEQGDSKLYDVSSFSANIVDYGFKAVVQVWKN